MWARVEAAAHAAAATDPLSAFYIKLFAATAVAAEASAGICFLVFFVQQFVATIYEKI